MTFNSGVFITSIALSSVLAAGSIAIYYRSNAITCQAQRDKLKGQLTSANETINDIQRRQRDVAEIDAKYTRELASAQATIDNLQHDVATGRRRLQFYTSGMPKRSTSPASMDDATSPRLTDSAERDYFTLRERIEKITKQLTGLQAYVHDQCLK
ncbi:lysis protein [Enterobacteriaceae bacterium RIT697]|nr:lysis protein [Enterobacteriaceae bacterium RIT697]